MYSHPQSYLRDWIYGAIDGTVTTFAVVSGVVGGQLAPLVILILGFANLLADGFSMAASNYLGTKAEKDLYDHYKAIETKQIEVNPKKLKADISRIFQKKGLSDKTLEDVTLAITANKTLGIETILQEEYGLPAEVRSPMKAAFYTFFAFGFFGLIPLLPYMLFLSFPFLWSCLLTGIVFFVIGSIKSFWSINHWIYSGTETLIIGSFTAMLAYSIGNLMHFYYAS